MTIKNKRKNKLKAQEVNRVIIETWNKVKEEHEMMIMNGYIKNNGESNKGIC